MKMKIETSKRGLPCLWENGGGSTNTGKATLIGNKWAQKKKPIYIKRSGHLAGGSHALIPIRVGDIVTKVWHHRKDYTIEIYQIVSIDLSDKTAELEKINEFSKGEWDYDLKPEFEDIVSAGKRKANCYHCRYPYFIKEE